MVRLLFAFVSEKGDKTGFGNMEIQVDQYPLTMADILNIEGQICKLNEVDNVKCIGITPLRIPEEKTATEVDDENK